MKPQSWYRNLAADAFLVLVAVLSFALFVGILSLFVGCGDNAPPPIEQAPDAGAPIDADLTDANCFTILRTCHCTPDGLEDCGITQQWDCGCFPQDGGAP